MGKSPASVHNWIIFSTLLWCFFPKFPLIIRKTSWNTVIFPEIWILEYYSNLHNSKKEVIEWYDSTFPQQQEKNSFSDWDLGQKGYRERFQTLYFYSDSGIQSWQNNEKTVSEVTQNKWECLGAWNFWLLVDLIISVSTRGGVLT